MMRIPLWTPSEEYVKSTNVYRFMKTVNEKHGLELSDYKALYRWSIDNIPDFWGDLWEFLDIKCSKPYDKVVDDLGRFPGAKWFCGARLNYAENLLRFRDGRASLVFRGENHTRRLLTRDKVYEQTVRLATAMRKAGIGRGDFVAAYMPNLPETVIAMLATSAVGAVWCSCATDIGPSATIDRLGQVKPRMLFTVDGYYYKGQRFDVTKNASAVALGMPTVEKVIVTHYAGGDGEVYKGCLWDDFLEPMPESFMFEQMEASDPTVVMFSSGTTGKPKCMVQSVSGLLINQLKELSLHTDLGDKDVMLYITTCSWMMWNWQAAAIGCGSTVVLFDGNPSYPDTSAIWKVLEEEGVTVFGLSASYIHSLMQQGFMPKDSANLSALRAISQTGSALSWDGFFYIYERIKKDLHFNSIAGGTDINGCFASGNPMSPVYPGELQAPGLGMPIECFGNDRKPVRDTQGELVCLHPTPSMPIYFWNDESGKRYRDAYFADFPGVWRHGDYVLFHEDTGGISFYGRSDSVLKPSGVRIGTAEIYNIVEKIPGIVESLVVGQEHSGDQRVILFVKLSEGVELTAELKKTIKTNLRANASPRHVPAIIIKVPDIPHTLNGKKVESAVANILNGRKVTNRDALSNPDSLDFYALKAVKLNTKLNH
ncbi:MAG: acetoacetate--CoA ligase [Christensenellales bacterium]